jgi:hypothetical protein
MAILGKYTIFGMQDAGLTWSSGIAKLDNKVKRLGVQDNLRLGDARDGNGRIFASNVERDSREMTLDLIPFTQAGADLAAAKANVKMPDPGAVITISDTGITLVDGNWNYVRGGAVELGTTSEEALVIRGIVLRQVSTDGVNTASQTKAT